MRPGLRAAAILACAGCVSQQIRPPATGWELTTDQPVLQSADAPPATQAQEANARDLLELLTPATEADLEPDYLDDQPPSPFHRLGRSVIRGVDGSWSKRYTVRTGTGDSIVGLLASIVPGWPAAAGEALPEDGAPDEVIRYYLHKDFYADHTETFGKRTQIGGGKIADLLVVTAPPETLLFIDDLLGRVLADIPQIELEVRIVEINLDDLIDWDVKWAALDLTDPSLPFDADTNPTAGNFGAGQPILDGAGNPTGAGAGFSSLSGDSTLFGFLMSLQGVRGNLRVDALLSLLQGIGASELISAPTITVLNGHKATLTTGAKVPVFEATGVGNNIQITTKFENVGITVELVPFLVDENVLRIDVSLDVSAVIREIPIQLAGADVTTPVISQRDAGTTVHVYSGQTFAVGGLRASQAIETISKVPLLGDIPVLGWLFKSRSSRRQNTEILFFVTPRIRIPSDSLLDSGTP